MRRGEIWWANLPSPEESEPGFRRPILIVQSDRFNQSSIRTVIGLVLTTNLRRAAAPGNVHVSAAESGLSKDSVVNVSQIYALDRSFLTEQAGTLPHHVMERVDAGLQLILDFT